MATKGSTLALAYSVPVCGAPLQPTAKGVDPDTSVRSGGGLLGLDPPQLRIKEPTVRRAMRPIPPIVAYFNRLGGVASRKRRMCLRCGGVAAVSHGPAHQAPSPISLPAVGTVPKPGTLPVQLARTAKEGRRCGELHEAYAWRCILQEPAPSNHIGARGHWVWRDLFVTRPSRALLLKRAASRDRFQSDRAVGTIGARSQRAELSVAVGGAL